MRTFALVSVLVLVGAVAAAKPTPDEAAMAREHYKRGTTLYDLGKYDEAIVEFQQAYEIKDDPVLLYNIAQSFRLASKYSEALRFYRTYLRRAPKAPNRDEVETKIADMENLIAQQQKVQASPSVDPIRPKGDGPAAIGARPIDGGAPKPAAGEPVAAATPKPATTAPIDEDEREGAPPPTKTEPATPPVAATTPPPPPQETAPEKVYKRGHKGMIAAGVVLAVLGLGAAGAGIGMGVMAMNASRDQEKGATYSPALADNGKLYQTVGLALDAGGGALALVGIIVAAVGGARRVEVPPQKVSFIPTVGSGLAGASLRLEF